MRETDLIQYYFDLLLTSFTSPIGLAGIVAALTLLLCSITIPATRWWCLLGALYASTLPLITVGVRFSPLAPPLEQLRQYARPLTYFFIILMLLPLLTSSRGWRRQLFGWPLLLFFLFEACICLRLAILGNEVRGMLSLMSYGLLLLTIGVALSRWLQSIDDVYRALWCVSGTGALVLAGTCWQLLINRSAILSGKRLTGITGNPQYLGLVIAYTLPVTCHLLTRTSGRKWVRPALIVQVALTIVMLLWTGSRTGALSSTVGLLVLYRRQLGRLAIFGGVVFAVVLLIMPFFQGSAESGSRLLWSQNTREQVWAIMIADFKSSPWVGVSVDTFEVRESSYLAMLAQFGLVGAFPFLLAFLAMTWQLVRLAAARPRFGPEKGLVDVATAFWATVFVASAFEGVLMGVYTVTIMLIYTFCSVTGFLVDAAASDAEAERAEVEYGGLPASMAT